MFVFVAHLGLISIFCFGMAAAAPEFCCSTMRIILRKAPDSWLEMIAGLFFNREVNFTSNTWEGAGGEGRGKEGGT